MAADVSTPPVTVGYLKGFFADHAEDDLVITDENGSPFHGVAVVPFETAHGEQRAVALRP